jgi:hypothetical protein
MAGGLVVDFDEGHGFSPCFCTKDNATHSGTIKAAGATGSLVFSGTSFLLVIAGLDPAIPIGRAVPS